MQRLGPWALRWQQMAQGRDDRKIGRLRTETKQASREVTFDRDTRAFQKLRDTMAGMARNLASSLDATGSPRTVHIKIRYADFSTITRQRRTGSITCADDIVTHSSELLDEFWDGRPVRLIGVGLSNFHTPARDQLKLSTRAHAAPRRLSMGQGPV